MKKFALKFLVLILAFLFLTTLAVKANEPELEPFFLTGDAVMYIPRSLGLFENPGDANYNAIISPQTVTVLDSRNGWFKINTWVGPRWINFDFMPSPNEANAFMRQFSNTSIFFYNIETGFTFTYNADRVFFGASISKASFALYMYQRADRGEIDLNREITLTWADWNAGSGVIQNLYRPGDNVTTRRLIELSLYQSDNIATLALRRVFGVEGYRQFIASLGANPHRVGDRIMNSHLTTNEVGIFARAIFNYIESDYPNSADFKAALLNNQFPFQVSDYEKASKTGWTTPSAWHDMSIIYANSPYILVIMSAREGWRAQDYNDFANISRFFQEFNDRWF